MRIRVGIRGFARARGRKRPCLYSWLKIEESKSLAIVYCQYYCDNAG